jgi:N-glycosylase/DNA lyase
MLANYKPNVKFINGNTVVSGVEHFDLKETLDCGQAFRWSPSDDGCWCGIALDKFLKIGHNQGEIIFYNTTLHEFYEKWYNYFDFDRDYGEIIDIISADKTLKIAAEQNKGIRILRQDKWETLCSFIISQNNNIPRIKGIIERLCENFGEKIEGGYSFPTAEKLAVLSPLDLAPVRAGFRARYIIDGAKKYLNNEIDLKLIETADTDTARFELMKITGVGVKVADCTLLFGFGRIDALPKDVWIKRALEKYFNGVLPDYAAPYAGIAQQYLFNYIRHLDEKNSDV